MPPVPPDGPAPTPGKAVAALLLGIAAFVVFPLGIILGPLALVFGIKALGRLKRLPPGTPGHGMAVTGIVLGGLGVLVGLTFGLAAIVFVLVSALGAGSEAPPALSLSKDDSGAGGVLTVSDVEAGVQWWEFIAAGDAGCVLPAGPVEVGQQVTCSSAGWVDLVHEPTGESVYATTFD